MTFFDQSLHGNNFLILLISSNPNFAWLVKFVLSIASVEFHSLIFEIRQNNIIVFLKIMWRKQTSFLPANIKSMNPMQKYPHITKSCACT